MNYQAKEDEVGGTCSANREKRTAYRLLVGKTGKETIRNTKT
jgi:hypothetical protein